MIGWFVMHHPEWSQLDSVVVKGKFTELNETMMMADVKPLLTQSLWHIKVDQIKSKLQQEPWVKSVMVRRQFPHQLLIKFTERKAVGQWGETHLIDQTGELFIPSNMDTFKNKLPFFYGEGLPLTIVLARCHEFMSRSLENKIEIKRCLVDARGAWQLVLSSGETILLGSHHEVARFETFLTMFDQLKTQFPTGITRVDMRYRHGFVVAKK